MSRNSSDGRAIGQRLFDLLLVPFSLEVKVFENRTKNKDKKIGRMLLGTTSIPRT
jgi:hypothetical protein